MAKKTSILSGSSFIFAAKIYWLIMGYVLLLILPRIVSVESYGIWGVVIGIISVLNMVVIMGTNQGISKFVSADEENSQAIRTLGFKIILALGFGIAIVFYLSSGIIARFLNDPSLQLYFRIAVFITLFYSFYAVNVGYINGLRRFKHQALLDVLFVSFKVLLVAGGGFLEIVFFDGHGLIGAISGFAIAAFIILLISFYLTGFTLERSPIKYTIKEVFGFIIWIMIFALILNLLMSVDLFYVKKLISESVDAANEQAGYYTAAITVSRIPYSIMMAVSIIIFPLISKVTSIDDKETTKTYINNSLRFALIVLLGVGSIISFNSEDILSFIVGAKYINGAESLSILSFNVVFLSLFTISSYIIAGSGKPFFPIIHGLIALVIDILLNIILIPIYGLTGAALSALISIFIGFIFTQVYILKKFKSHISLLTLLKSITAVILLYFISNFIGDFSGFLVFIKALFLLIIFALLLIVFKELRREEIELMLRKVYKLKSLSDVQK